MRTFLGLVATLLVLVGCSSSDDPEITTASLGNADTIEVTVAVPTAVPPTLLPEPTVEPTPATAIEETPEPTSADVGDGLFPTVVDASATSSDGVTWRVDVTLLSEYDSPARYADAWRVLDGDDNELGIRVLAHDHAGEQPFTRSTNVEIPAEVATVFVEGRDQVNGWSGERFELTIER